MQNLFQSQKWPKIHIERKFEVLLRKMLTPPRPHQTKQNKTKQKLARLHNRSWGWSLINRERFCPPIKAGFH